MSHPLGPYLSVDLDTGHGSCRVDQVWPKCQNQALCHPHSSHPVACFPGSHAGSGLGLASCWLGLSPRPGSQPPGIPVTGEAGLGCGDRGGPKVNRVGVQLCPACAPSGARAPKHTEPRMWFPLLGRPRLQNQKESQWWPKDPGGPADPGV